MHSQKFNSLSSQEGIIMVLPLSYPLDSKNTKVDSLSMLRIEKNREPESIILSSCWIKAIPWDFNQNLLLTD